MTIKQYQTIAKTIASKIEELGGNPTKVRNLRLINGKDAAIAVRDPRMYVIKSTTLEHGSNNTTIEFDTVSNPNNPNYKFRTLKPGSMSFYNSQTNMNADITEYNFDTFQFAALIEILKNDCWEIVR